MSALASESELVEKIKTKILGIKGILAVYLLTDEDREIVGTLEEQAAKDMFGGLGGGRNEGVSSCLSREIAMALLTGPSFKVPWGEMMLLVSDGEVVGTMIKDPEAINSFLQKEDYALLGGTFIVNKRKAKLNFSDFLNGTTYFLFKGVKLEIFNMPEIKDHILASPSGSVFDFLKNKFMATESGRSQIMSIPESDMAIFLFGFDFVKGS